MENLNVNQFEVGELAEVVELNENELQDVQGGLLPLIGALALFDACLWGYIALK